MLILGIETSCDETAAAVLFENIILSNVIASQIDLHTVYGGVVPELACRRHIDVIIPVIDQALKLANKTLDQIDLIAVTQGPGLVGALLIGLNAAKALALALNKSLIGVNHIKAHLYAPFLSKDPPKNFPCLGVIISGGHTTLVKVNSPIDYTLISETVDDAIGEAFDKVAKMVGLPYPGGPQIERAAQHGNPFQYNFKAGNVKNQPLSFSFSGLKTAVLYTLQKLSHKPSYEQICDIAASFQQAAFSDISKKINLAANSLNIQHVVFGGGVSNSQTLRAFMANNNPELFCYWPETHLSLDNAAMIAGLGYATFIASNPCNDFLKLEANPNMHL